jgi:hypothetical protein
MSDWFAELLKDPDWKNKPLVYQGTVKGTISYPCPPQNIPKNVETRRLFSSVPGVANIPKEDGTN